MCALLNNVVLEAEHVKMRLSLCLQHNLQSLLILNGMNYAIT